MRASQRQRQRQSLNKRIQDNQMLEILKKSQQMTNQKKRHLKPKHQVHLKKVKNPS